MIPGHRIEPARTGDPVIEEDKASTQWAGA